MNMSSPISSIDTPANSKLSHNGLQIFLFGKPRICLNSDELRLKRRKSMALLAYLAMHTQVFDRDYLTELLWPNTKKATGYSNLRNTLADLNATPLKNYLHIDREKVEVSDDLRVDALELEKNLWFIHNSKCDVQVLSPECEARMVHSVELYTGDFMAFFEVKESPEFEDWQLVQTMKYQQALQEILMILAVHYVHQGQDEAAVRYSNRLLQIDPANEPAVRLLMSLYQRNHQVNYALHHYHMLIRILERDYARHPSEETLALYKEICNRYPSAIPKAPVSRR